MYVLLKMREVFGPIFFLCDVNKYEGGRWPRPGSEVNRAVICSGPVSTLPEGALFLPRFSACVISPVAAQRDSLKPQQSRAFWALQLGSNLVQKRRRQGWNLKMARASSNHPVIPAKIS